MFCTASLTRVFVITEVCTKGDPQGEYAMAKGTLVERTAAPTTRTDDGLIAGSLGPPRTLWGDAWRRFRRHKLAIIGAIVLISFILLALLGPLLWQIGRAHV